MNESIQDYHANVAISHSKLECYRRRPALYYKKYIAKTLAQPDESTAFRLGSAVHCAILEEKEFAARYVQKPDLDRRTLDTGHMIMNSHPAMLAAALAELVRARV